MTLKCKTNLVNIRCRTLLKLLALPLFLLMSLDCICAQNFEFKILSFEKAKEIAEFEAKNIIVIVDHPTFQNQKDFLGKTLQQQSLKDFFQEHFIGVLMTPERFNYILPDSHPLSKNYLYYFDAEGNMLHYVNYAMVDLVNLSHIEKEEMLIEMSLDSFDEDQQIVSLKNRYEQGDRSVKFLSQHLLALKKSYLFRSDFEALNNEFLELATIENYPQRKVLETLFETTVRFQEEAALELRLNLDELYKIFPKKKVQKKLLDLTLGSLRNKNEPVEQEELDEIIAFARMSIDSFAPNYSDYLQFMAVDRKDHQSYFEAARNYYDNNEPFYEGHLYPTVQLLIYNNWDSYSVSVQKDVIASTESWMRSALKRNPSYSNHDYLARILLKAERLEEARNLLLDYDNKIHSENDQRKITKGKSCTHKELCFTKSPTLIKVEAALKAKN